MIMVKLKWHLSSEQSLLTLPWPPSSPPGPPMDASWDHKYVFPVWRGMKKYEEARSSLAASWSRVSWRWPPASWWAGSGWGSAAAPGCPAAWWRAPTSTRRGPRPASSTRARGRACRRSGRGSRSWCPAPYARTRSPPPCGSSRACFSNLQEWLY